MAASYEAKAFGVKTPMPGRMALELCPHAVVVSPRFEAYSAASKEVFAIFDDTAPLVEGISIDEAFIDVRGMRRIAGAPVEIAARLRERVREEVGLPITVGVARTKFLAKVASGVAKPDGLLLVEPARELEFLHPLPVEKLWGVGVKTADKLHARGISTVGEVAGLSELALVGMLGKASGRQLHALANERDPRRVTVGVRRRSIGGQRAIGRRGVVEDARAAGRDAGRADRPDHPAAAGGAAGRADRDPPAALRRLHARDALADARCRRPRSRACCCARRGS